MTPPFSKIPHKVPKLFAEIEGGFSPKLMVLPCYWEISWDIGECAIATPRISEATLSISLAEVKKCNPIATLQISSYVAFFLKKSITGSFFYKYSTKFQ